MTRWVRLTRGARAPAKLFCFHHAGGAPSAFAPWAGASAPELEIWSVELPGRGSRLREPPLWEMEPLIEALVASVPGELDRRYAFLGHSMGAWVAFELARALEREGVRGPEALFVAGMRAPHLADRFPAVHDMAEEELVDTLRWLGGSPEAVLRDRDLRELFLPAIRADHAVIENHLPAREPPVAAPIHAFAGTSDPKTTAEEVDGWSEHTASLFTATWLEGDHFFLHADPDGVLARIKRLFVR